MVVSRETVLEIVKRKGPLIPAVIAKDIKMDLLFAQAYLSELSSAKLIRVSNIKVGGSPLYYVPGQEKNLQNYSERLNEKDKRAYDKLKEAKVLRESDQDPLTRVCLRQIKDFAIMLEVNTGGETEIFWKWYECDNSEVTPLIKEILGISKTEPKQNSDVQKLEPSESEKTVSGGLPISNSQTKSIERNQVAVQRESPKQTEFKSLRKELSETKSIKTDIQKKLSENDVSIETYDLDAQIKNQIKEGDEFLKDAFRFFTKNKIEISNFKTIRKNSDVEFVVSVPSAVGPVDFFCKAKSKKRCNDGDLSSAFVSGQLKKLPVLFLTTGELTKKAEGMLSKEFNGMKVHKI